MKTKTEMINRLAEINKAMRVLRLEELHIIRQLYNDAFKTETVFEPEASEPEEECEVETVVIPENDEEVEEDYNKEDDERVLYILNNRRDGIASDNCFRKTGLLRAANSMVSRGLISKSYSKDSHHAHYMLNGTLL